MRPPTLGSGTLSEIGRTFTGSFGRGSRTVRTGGATSSTATRVREPPRASSLLCPVAHRSLGPLGGGIEGVRAEGCSRGSTGLHGPREPNSAPCDRPRTRRAARCRHGRQGQRASGGTRARSRGRASPRGRGPLDRSTGRSQRLRLGVRCCSGRVLLADDLSQVEGRPGGGYEHDGHSGSTLVSDPE